MVSFGKSVCIVGGGTVYFREDHHIIEDHAPDRLIAADGGALHIPKPFSPAYVIGDFDSTHEKKWEKVAKCIHISDQNTTDLEKCLNIIKAPLYVCLGFTGDRLDHTLSIQHVLLQYPKKRIIFIAKKDLIFLLPETFDTRLPIGSRLSLYPLLPTAVRKNKGLVYNAKGLRFEQGKRIGTSNRVIKPDVHITTKGRGLACIMSRDHYPLIRKALL